MNIINLCKEEVGYSVHTFDSITQKMILGRKDIPNWSEIFTKTTSPMRVSIVINRCNIDEFFNIINKLSIFPNIRYIQARRISTETRTEKMEPDIRAYEELYSNVVKIFPRVDKIATDADVFDIYGKNVTFWRTIKTSANSINYFTDGTISNEYFIIEGYAKQKNISLEGYNQCK